MGRVVDVLADVLRAAGVARIHGVPGEGSTLDLVDAAAARGLDYVLTAHETAAAFMAAAEAELTGRPGVCLVTRGPGLTNAATGIAHAWLDRVPLLVVADEHAPETAGRIERQWLPQLELFRPITRWQASLGPLGPRRSGEAAVRATLGPPPGPVLLGLPAGPATAAAEPEPPDPAPAPPPPPAADALAAASRAIARAARPVLLAGLGARAGDAPARLVALAERLGAATLTTAKAKGVIPARHPLHGGTLPGPAARQLLESADLVIAAGFDPVELPHAWRSPAPVVRLDRGPYRGEYFSPALEVVGDPAAALAALAGECAARAAWDPREIGGAREAERRHFDRGPGLTPYRVLALAREQVSQDAVVSVDAGAHKQLANVVWDADRPSTYLTSNGLASMAYALPAAAAAAMVTGRRAVCFTGDGGLLMTLGELETVGRLGLPVTVVVFADAGHSIIRVHQMKRGLRTLGVDLSPLAYDRLAAELGGRGQAVSTPEGLVRALDAAGRDGGLSVVAARVDPAWYHTLG
jgi:acetolactate synthase-1/2/3 large subunit